MRLEFFCCSFLCGLYVDNPIVYPFGIAVTVKEGRMEGKKRPLPFARLFVLTDEKWAARQMFRAWGGELLIVNFLARRGWIWANAFWPFFFFLSVSTWYAFFFFSFSLELDKCSWQGFFLGIPPLHLSCPSQWHWDLHLCHALWARAYHQHRGKRSKFWHGCRPRN